MGTWTDRLERERTYPLPARLMLLGSLVCLLASASVADLTVESMWPPPDRHAAPLGEEHPYLAKAMWNGQDVTNLSTAWTWDFGDGSDPIATNPAWHAYTVAGTYLATVTATYMGQQASATASYSTSNPIAQLSWFPGTTVISDQWDLELTDPPSAFGIVVLFQGFECIRTGLPEWTPFTGPGGPLSRGPGGIGPWSTTPPPEGVTRYGWLFKGWPNGQTSLRAKYHVLVSQPPVGGSVPQPPTVTYSNAVSAETRNLEVAAQSDHDPCLIFFDPSDPARNTMTIAWDAIHQEWVHPQWDPEYLDYEASFLSLDGAGALRVVTGTQTNPGPCSVTWNGQPTGPAPPPPPPGPGGGGGSGGGGGGTAATKGIYTYRVGVGHRAGPNADMCFRQYDKAPRVATVEHSYYYELDDAADKMRGSVQYKLDQPVGECEVRIYGPDFTERWSWSATGDDLETGSHLTEPYEIDATIVNGQLTPAGGYWAVVLTKQRQEDCLIPNRPLSPRWQVPHGTSSPEVSKVRSVRFDDDVQMVWPVHPDHGPDALVGSPAPEWTNYSVSQDWLRERPYWAAGGPGHNQPYSALKNEPAAYVRKSQPGVDKVPVTVEVTGTPNATMLVSATGSGPLGGVVEQSVTLGANGVGQFSSTSVHDLPDEVAVLRVGWMWRARPNAGGPYTALGGTTHNVYVTLKPDTIPQLELCYGRYEQLFRISCTAAQGATSEPDTFEGIWAELEDRVVVGDRGVVYRYWGMLHGTGLTTVMFPHGLITEFDGQCGAWAYFLEDCARAHGIAAGRIWVGPCAPVGPTPYLPSLEHPGEARIGMWVADPQVGPVAPAQGGDPLVDQFGNHFVCVYPNDSTIYDPSYGSKVGPVVGGLGPALFSYEHESIWKYAVPPPPGGNEPVWIPNHASYGEIAGVPLPPRQ